MAEPTLDEKALEALVEREWRNLCEKDDRTSPAEYPEMLLITQAELKAAMGAAYLAAEPAQSVPDGWPQGPFQRYRHYKGGLYEVLGDAMDEATQTHLVLYRSVTSACIWARPFKVFHGEVAPGKRRFDLVSPILPPSPPAAGDRT